MVNTMFEFDLPAKFTDKQREEFNKRLANKVMKEVFDVWEYPQQCEGCGRQDNYSKEAPTCYLDAETKLCEMCFADLTEI